MTGSAVSYYLLARPVLDQKLEVRSQLHIIRLPACKAGEMLLRDLGPKKCHRKLVAPDRQWDLRYESFEGLSAARTPHSLRAVFA